MGTVRYTVVNGEILAERRDGVRKRYIPDPLGSTAALTDSTGAITDTWKYWPYGEVRARTGTTPTKVQFVGTLGYRRDSDSRDYVRARHLSVNTGRWLTVDPVRPGDTGRSAFLYAAAAPVTRVDVAGLLCLDGPSPDLKCLEMCDDLKKSPYCKKNPKKEPCKSILAPGGCDKMCADPKGPQYDPDCRKYCRQLDEAECLKCCKEYCPPGKQGQDVPYSLCFKSCAKVGL